jgi:hypothetical protein
MVRGAVLLFFVFEEVLELGRGARYVLSVSPSARPCFARPETGSQKRVALRKRTIVILKSIFIGSLVLFFCLSCSFFKHKEATSHVMCCSRKKVCN